MTLTKAELEEAKRICEPYNGMNTGVGEATIMVQKAIDASRILPKLIQALEESQAQLKLAVEGLEEIEANCCRCDHFDPNWHDGDCGSDVASETLNKIKELENDQS